MSQYYDDDDDDDPYAPRIGPAAMPSPRSKYAPYYSGRANTFEDFLEEFEGRAYDCALTGPQRVDTLIRYVDPTLRELCRTLDGSRSRNWLQFRQSLVNIFGNPTPRHQIMRQKLHSHVQDSSRRRMDCEDDVLQYYRQFLCYSAPLVHAGHLSKEERDVAFLCGFHPEDRKVIRPRLLSKNPFQPPDIPFHFEDVLSCARAAFAYDDYFPSPRSHAKQFEPPSLRREQPIVEPALRDAYSFRAVTRVVVSNAETTTIPDELPPSSQSHDIQLSSSSSPSVSESQHTQAPSVTFDQPEPTYTLSSTLLPSSSFATQSHTPSLVYSATDNDPIFAPTFPITTSTLLPSVSPTLSHSHSLAHSAAEEIPEILSTFPSPSTTPAPLSMPTSDFEYLSSATVDQPEPAPTLSSTPPCPPSIPSTLSPSPARLAAEHQSEPEPASTLFASVPALTSTSPHVHSAADNGTIFASTPPSLSPTSSTFVPFPVRSAMNNQPESEHEAASTSMSVPLLSLPLSTLHPLSPLSSTSLPSPVTSATDDQPEPESMSVSVISTKFGLSPRALPFPPDQKLDLPPRALSPPPDWLLVPSSTLLSLPLPEMSTLDSLPLIILSPDQSSSSSGSLSHLSRPRELESSSPTLAPSDVVTLSHPESSLSLLGETIPLLLAQHEASVTVPTSRHSTPPQRSPGFTTVGSDSSLLGVTLAPASDSPTPFVPRSQELPTVHEAPSTLAPHLPLASPPLLLSRSGFARFNFALVFITTAVLVSTFFNVWATLSILAHKYWNKNEDFGNIQIGTLNTSSRDVFAQQLRLGQYTPRASRFVFDPGGPASSSRLFGTRRRSQAQVEDTKRLLRHARRHPYSHSSQQSHRFDPGGGAFVLEPAHEDSATLDEEDVQ